MTTVAPFPAAPDWSTGTDETTAEQLRPAAAVLVDRAAPEPGETVVGVDPARRLLRGRVL